MRDFLQDRFVRPLAALLSQGMPPDRIALSMAVALSLSVIPLLGTATGLCLLVAFAFRLNVAAMQVVNWAATPIQFALLWPFYHFGARLAGLPALSYTPASLREAAQADPFGLLDLLWRHMLAGTALWLVLAVPATGLLVRLFLPLLRRIKPDAAREPTRGRGAFPTTVGGTL